MLVTSISTTRDEVPGILNPTVNPGKLRDGFNLTGSSGINATPTKARQTKATIRVKEEADFIKQLVKNRWLILVIIKFLRK